MNSNREEAAALRRTFLITQSGSRRQRRQGTISGARVSSSESSPHSTRLPEPRMRLAKSATGR